MDADAGALLAEAIALHDRGALAEAAARYDRVLKADPGNVEVLFRLGRVQCQEGNISAGMQTLRRTLAIDPRHARAHNLLGMALHRTGALEDALSELDQAVVLDPDMADAHDNRAALLCDLNRYAEAIKSFDRALELNPANAAAWNDRGIALVETRQFDAAVMNFDRALALDPHRPEFHDNRGRSLGESGRLDEALAAYDRALALAQLPGTCADRGLVLIKLGRYDEALQSLQRSLELDRRCARAYVNLGALMSCLHRWGDALANYDRAVEIEPAFAEAQVNRGRLLHRIRDYPRALEAFERAYAANPRNREAFGRLLATKQAVCDWTNRPEDLAIIDRNIRQELSVVDPFTLLGMFDDPTLHLQCARACAKFVAPSERLDDSRTSRNHSNIRLAYVSADFVEHPVAFLIPQLFKLHDRAKFEVHAFSLSENDGSAVRARIESHVDQFHDVAGLGDPQVAHEIAAAGIDIAIDTTGYTGDGRPAIFAYRPAPIQVSYLGYPGTLGADFVDYVLADPLVLPFDQQPVYAERIVHLPYSYLVSDTTRAVSERTLSRAEAGLPESGFVFCCFNTHYKFAPPVFDVWMRLLNAIPDSVLWLSSANDLTVSNLRREAAARGIEPARLVFAARVPMDEHLARYRLADLFVDTLPYNAHSTASEALWAGLPVLTCAGRSFASRVAASLLHSIGLTELVATSLADYEALALKLATRSVLLGDIRRKLMANRSTHPLFDTVSFARHIESAYATMWKIYTDGEPPRSFSVDPS